MIKDWIYDNFLTNDEKSIINSTLDAQRNYLNTSVCFLE